MNAIYKSGDNNFVESVASAFIEGYEIEHLAAMYAITHDELANRIQANEAAISAELAQMHADGRDIRVKSRAALGKSVTQLTTAIDSGSLPPGQLSRVIEVLHKVSGMETELRNQSEESTGRFILNIHFSGGTRSYGDTEEPKVIDGQTLEVSDGFND